MAERTSGECSSGSPIESGHQYFAEEEYTFNGQETAETGNVIHRCYGLAEIQLAKAETIPQVSVTGAEVPLGCCTRGNSFEYPLKRKENLSAPTQQPEHCPPGKDTSEESKDRKGNLSREDIGLCGKSAAQSWKIGSVRENEKTEDVHNRAGTCRQQSKLEGRIFPADKKFSDKSAKESSQIIPYQTRHSKRKLMRITLHLLPSRPCFGNLQLLDFSVSPIGVRLEVTGFWHQRTSDFILRTGQLSNFNTLNKRQLLHGLFRLFGTLHPTQSVYSTQANRGSLSLVGSDDVTRRPCLRNITHSRMLPTASPLSAIGMRWARMSRIAQEDSALSWEHVNLVAAMFDMGCPLFHKDQSHTSIHNLRNGRHPLCTKFDRSLESTGRHMEDIDRREDFAASRFRKTSKKIRRLCQSCCCCLTDTQ